MSDHPVLPGAEPFSAVGGPTGVLVCHGFTGNPHSMRGLAGALAAAGHTVELPRLPGHGTHVDDMLDTTWDDYSTTVEAAYADLAARTDQIVVAGLSMGGTLTVWLAANHPEIAGIVCINAAVEPSPEMTPAIQAMVDTGQEVMDGIGSDIADPDSHETAYPETPLRPLLSLGAAVEALQPRLADVRCPVLVMTSPNDHVVAPSAGDHLAASVGGPVERLSLDRSFHVATLDYDKDLIIERTLAFVERVTA